MDWRERIAVDADVLVGKPVIKGTRIAVELVIDLLARGYTAQQSLPSMTTLRSTTCRRVSPTRPRSCSRKRCTRCPADRHGADAHPRGRERHDVRSVGVNFASRII